MGMDRLRFLWRRPSQTARNSWVIATVVAKRKGSVNFVKIQANVGNMLSALQASKCFPKPPALLKFPGQDSHTALAKF